MNCTPFDRQVWYNTCLTNGVFFYTCSDENGKPYSQSYLKTINNRITAIFNYAVKYFGLKNAGQMEFGRKDASVTYIEAIKDRPACYGFIYKA